MEKSTQHREIEDFLSSLQFEDQNKPARINNKGTNPNEAQDFEIKKRTKQPSLGNEPWNCLDFRDKEEVKSKFHNAHTLNGSNNISNELRVLKEESSFYKEAWIKLQ